MWASGGNQGATQTISPQPAWHASCTVSNPSHNHTATRDAQAFGIDKSPSQIAKAISRHQQQQHNLSFHQVEAWDLNTVLKVAAAAGVQFSVVFIDVSGSRRVGDIDNLVMKYEQVREKSCKDNHPLPPWRPWSDICLLCVCAS